MQQPEYAPLLADAVAAEGARPQHVAGISDLCAQARRLLGHGHRQVEQLGVSITPLHPESALRAAGARFECVHHPLRDFFANHFVTDGDLVTGQNQNAGPMVARLMMERVLTKAPAARA